MTKSPSGAERRKQARLEKLGTDNPICGICGNSDWRTIEQHHVAGQKHDETVVLLCANDHRIVTDDQKDHAEVDPAADPFLNKIGHFLLGLADMLQLIVEKLYEFGLALIKQAAGSPGEGCADA